MIILHLNVQCSQFWLLLFVGRSVELDHVWPSFIHDFFQIKSIGIIPLEQFQEVVLADVYEMPKQISKDLAFSYFWSVFRLHVRQILFLLILFWYSLSWLLLGHIFHMAWPFVCFFVARDLNCWKCCCECAMRSSLWRLIVPLSSWRSRWKRQWSKSGRTTYLLFVSTFLFIILPLAWFSSRKSKFITTWILNWRCS